MEGAHVSPGGGVGEMEVHFMEVARLRLGAGEGTSQFRGCMVVWCGGSWWWVGGRVGRVG